MTLITTDIIKMTCVAGDGTLTVFIRIEAQAFISYKRFLTKARVLNPCVYSCPGVYMSPAFIPINTVVYYPDPLLK